MASGDSISTHGKSRKKAKRDDLWHSAFCRLEKDPTYKKDFVKFQDVLRKSLHLDRPGKMFDILATKEGQQKLQQQISAKAHSLRADDSKLGSVMKAVLRTKDLVGSAASASPPASLAVAGLFFVVTMGENYLRENGAMADCIELAANVVESKRLAESETRSPSVLENLDLQDRRTRLREKYIEVYKKVMYILIKLVVSLDSNWTSLKSLLGSSFWVAERTNLDFQNRACNDILSDIRSFKTSTAASDVPDDFKKLGRNLLHFNAWLGNSSKVADLTQGHDFSANDADLQGRTPLSLAAENGHLECCNNLLPWMSAKEDRNRQDHAGFTALHYAAGGDHDAVVKLLVSCVDPNLCNALGQSALHTAAWCGSSKAVGTLRNAKGIKLDLQDKDGRTALHLAVLRKKPAVVKLLADKKAKLDIRDKEDRVALFDAVKVNNSETVKLLIEKGADVNLKTATNKWTTLHMCAASGYSNCLKALLASHKVEINAQNKQGRTPLHEAVLTKNKYSVKELCQKGAIVDVRAENQRTAFLDATDGRRTDIMKILIEHGADPMQRTATHQWTALHICAAHGDLASLKLLLDIKGVDIDARTKRGRTPLYEAVVNDQFDVVNILCDKGAEIDARADNKRTAFLDAAKNGRLPIVKKLRESGADIDQITGVHKWSALHEAADKNHLEVAKYLLQEGIKLDLRAQGGTKKGMTAREIAASRKHGDIVELLEAVEKGSVS